MISGTFILRFNASMNVKDKIKKYKTKSKLETSYQAT